MERIVVRKGFSATSTLSNEYPLGNHVGATSLVKLYLSRVSCRSSGSCLVIITFEKLKVSFVHFATDHHKSKPNALAVTVPTNNITVMIAAMQAALN